MNLLDDRFLRNKTRYLSQCALATVATMIVLIGLHAIASQAVIGALGATAFIVFTMPGRHVSRTRFLIGGYVVGIAAGVAFHWLLRAALPTITAGTDGDQLAKLVFGAGAVGMAILLMVLTNTEHPPAAGMALGIVLGDWHPEIIPLVLVGVIALAALKGLLRPVLIDLL